jgi:hypothetical protein
MPNHLKKQYALSTGKMPVPPNETPAAYGSFFTAIGNAAASVACCLFRRRRERPGSVLRCLCVAAFDFAARTGGRPLDREKRKALGCLLDLGAIINDHFDQHQFCRHTYRKLRRQLVADADARAVYREYFRQVRQTERSRPRLSGRENLLKEVVHYRERVVRLSLSALAAIAFSRPEIADDACPADLFALAMLIQICDDLLDWRKDWRTGLPTFVTAAVLQDAGQAEEKGGKLLQAPKELETVAAKYLSVCSKHHGFNPIALCCHAAFLFVKLLCRLILRNGSNILVSTRSMRTRGIGCHCWLVQQCESTKKGSTAGQASSGTLVF